MGLYIELRYPALDDYDPIDIGPFDWIEGVYNELQAAVNSGEDAVPVAVFLRDEGEWALEDRWVPEGRGDRFTDYVITYQKGEEDDR